MEKNTQVDMIFHHIFTSNKYPRGERTQQPKNEMESFNFGFDI